MHNKLVTADSALCLELRHLCVNLRLPSLAVGISIARVHIKMNSILGRFAFSHKLKKNPWPRPCRVDDRGKLPSLFLRNPSLIEELLPRFKAIRRRL